MPEDPGTEETVEQGEQFIRLVAEDQHRRVLAWIGTLAGRRSELPSMPWTVSDWPLQLTLAQAQELKIAITDLILRYRRDPDDPGGRVGTVRAHIALQLTPEEQ